MINYLKGERIKSFFSVILAILSGVVSASLLIVYVTSAGGGLLSVYGNVICFVVATVICLITAFTVAFVFYRKNLFYKTGLLCLILLAIFSIALYVLSATGFLDKIDSVEDLREFISSYGGLSVLIFLLVQILQVTVVPIPGVITIGAGVLLFGPLLGAILSYFGILLGSIIAFFIGKKLGYKVACWLVGKDGLDKGLALVKGKDKIVLTFMFLFPFFPDDVLCFVSGLTTMSTGYFIVVNVITRFISTFTTAYSVNGSLIPYDTWWGLAIWGVLIACTIWLVKIVYNNSEKIEKIFKRLKK